MKTRKHHNNKAYRSTIRGKRTAECEQIAKRLKVAYCKPNLKEFIDSNSELATAISTK